MYFLLCAMLVFKFYSILLTLPFNFFCLSCYDVMCIALACRMEKKEETVVVNDFTGLVYITVSNSMIFVM
jgi:hypothetical protein